VALSAVWNDEDMQKPYSLHVSARNLARVLTLPMKVTDVANFNRSESIGRCGG
jgi:hypothetical protein